jgi:hypothetical protein
MSSEAVICYPAAFLERPEDRRCLLELAATGCPREAASLMLYRIWADYSTGRSDRRVVRSSLAELASDPEARLMEGFCGWTGAPGGLVIAAVSSGFLRHEERDGVKWLVCHGFFPINSTWCRDGKSFQKRGGLSRSLQKQANAVDREAREVETLWDKTGHAEVDGLTAAARGDALRLCMRICRAMDMPRPTDAEMKSGCLRLAKDILAHGSESINETLLWLIGNRTSPEIPRRLDQILRDWDRFLEKAKREMA